jgi:hypothetical protein
MASQYVPPHLRNRIAKATEVDLKPESFPVLSGSAPVRTNAGTWTKPKSFASLAREWNEKADDEKLQREMNEQRERSRIQRENMEQRIHFVYREPRQAYDGFVYDSYEEPEALPKDEWKDVSHKKLRPELTLEEKMEKQARMEAEEADRNDINDESVWKTEEWDYRDRRTYS